MSITEKERAELKELLREMVVEAVKEAFKNLHTCNFDDKERKALHQMADHFTLDQLTALSLLAKTMNSVGAKIGQALIWMLFGGAIAFLVWLASRGLLPKLAPTP